MTEIETSKIELGRSTRWIVRIVLVVLVVQFLILGLIQAWEDSFTFDESVYMTSGSTALRERDLRINFEHPPLPKILSAIPAELFGTVDIPLDTDAWDQAETWGLSLDTVAANQDDIQRTTFLYRIAPLLEAIAIGILLYLLGRDLFGWKSGLFASFLWMTLPIAVGFGHLNGLDIPATLTVVFTLWLLNRYLDRPTWSRLAWVIGSVGIALLTRAGVGLVIAGVAFAVVLISDVSRHDRTALTRALAVPLGGWAIVWLGYLIIAPSGFDPSLYSGFTQEAITAPPTSLPAVVALLVPWPAGFDAGIRFLSHVHSIGDFPGYLFGISFTGAPPWFWVGSLFLKLTPVALLAILAGAISWFWLPRDVVKRAALVLLPMLLGLTAMMSFAQRPFGVRYLIPIIVILLLVAAPLTELATARWALAVLGVAAALQLGMLWESHPHSLAWSNPITRESWQLASDANVDWGQDFYRLQGWAGDKESVYVSYFGFGPSRSLDEVPNAISANPPPAWGTPPFPPSMPEWIAISASNLNDYRRDEFGLLREYCPVDILGATILVYHFETTPSELSGDTEHIARDLCPDQEFSTRP